MLTKKDLELLTSKRILDSKPRTKYVELIKPWLKEKHIIILKGIRRCGKTHLMHQLMDLLPEQNVFYVDFDDFRLENHLNIETLEKIISLRDKKKNAYFFLDEIQRVEGFEKWLRTYYEREEKIKFIIGGSNISLLSPKLSTVLTGRVITFEIFPLDYNEFKQFSKGKIEEYLKFGGLPEIVLSKNEQVKRKMLEQYVDDIISKDILQKNKITTFSQLKKLTMFLLNNPGTKISANKLGKQIGVHKDTAKNHLELLKDTFLI